MRKKFNFILCPVDVQLSQCHLLKRLFFLLELYWLPYKKINWLQMWRFIWWALNYILFINMSKLSHVHIILITEALQCVLKLEVNPPIFFFSFQDYYLTRLVSLNFCMYFQVIFVNLYKESSWDLIGTCCICR